MGIAEAADAETSLEGVIRALTASVLVGAALAHATSGRPVAVLRSDESVRAIASG